MMEFLSCKAILFDLDGVLTDSTECIRRHWHQWGAEVGIDLAQIMAVAHGRRTVETIRLVAPQLDADFEARRIEQQEANDTQGVVAIPGAAELLKSLPGQAWAIATSGTRNVATARLKSTGLPIPQALVAADDVLHGKPHPEPFLEAARRLGVSPEHCIVMEDAPAGIEAGLAAGMQVVGIASSHEPDQLTRASLTVRRLTDLNVTVQEDGTLFIRWTS